MRPEQPPLSLNRDHDHQQKPQDVNETYCDTAMAPNSEPCCSSLALAEHVRTVFIRDSAGGLSGVQLGASGLADARMAANHCRRWVSFAAKFNSPGKPVLLAKGRCGRASAAQILSALHPSSAGMLLSGLPHSSAAVL